MALNISYDGSDILTLGEGTYQYTLDCSGKMMDTDVTVQYSMPAISETTATASDVESGKYFFSAAGIKTAGTKTPTYTLLAEQDFEVNTTSTAEGTVGTISAGTGAYTANAIIYVKVRDKAGARSQHFLGSDTYFFNCWPIANPGQAIQAPAHLIHRYTDTSVPATASFGRTGSTTGYGVYPSQISSDGTVTINRRYSSTYSLVINGTYNVQVYSIPYAPTQGNPYDYSFS